jgi:hypothetical protein
MRTVGLTEHAAAEAATCAFPACDGEAVTSAAMCEGHRRVTVSQTGSWLEAG